MLQAERDPELADLLDRDTRRDHAGVATLVARAADTGQIEPPGDAAQTAIWITTMVGGLYLAAATDDTYDAADDPSEGP